MSTRSVLSVFAALAAGLLLLLVAGAPGDASAHSGEPGRMRVALMPDTPSVARAEPGGFAIDGPFVHDNLSLFLVRGPGRDAGAAMLTLEEAMAAGKLVVHETGSVNQLEVENVGDEQIFIQASEIVKGGQQDRALAVDMIVPPKSGRVPIAAFCVEHGRWSQRGGESVAAFNSAKGALNSKELKLAARYEADQSKVWAAVSRTQEKLARAAGRPVADERSSSSLQLTLENGDVGRLADAYVAALAGLPEGRDDVIGYAFAINGVVNSAEVYASPALFRKLWRKMLRAVALEAAAERGEPARGPVGVADVTAVLDEAEHGVSGRPSVAGAARGLSFDADSTVLFETRAGSAKAWVHRSYVRK